MNKMLFHIFDLLKNKNNKGNTKSIRANKSKKMANNWASLAYFV